MGKGEKELKEIIKGQEKDLKNNKAALEKAEMGLEKEKEAHGVTMQQLEDQRTANEELKVEKEALEQINDETLNELNAAKDENEELKKALKEARDLNYPEVQPLSEDEPELSKHEIDLIEAGCEAYGIPREFIFNARIDRATGEAVILTNGGKKVRYAKGMEEEEGFQPLSRTEVDGIIRKKMNVIAGKKK